MSDRVALFSAVYSSNEWADWKIEDYPHLSKLAAAAAWHLPLKIFAPDFEIVKRFVRRLWRTACMPATEISTIYLVEPGGKRTELTQEQYDALEAGE